VTHPDPGQAPSAPLWLVDSSIYVFRAWFTLPEGITDQEGHPANAVLGFTEFLLRLLTRLSPAPVAFAFDESLGGSVRKQIYPEYKANRPPAPESLKRQFRLCRAFIRALGFTELASTRHEADDIIGTLAARHRARGAAIHLITADKDLTQLVGPRDLWWEFQQDRRLDARGVEKHLGVRPEQVADQLALAGDKVDNIPGVPGIGMATAARLLRRFGSLEQLLGDIDAVCALQIRGAKRIAALLHEHQETVRLARRLTGIDCDIDDLPEDLDLTPAPTDRQALEDLMELLGFDISRRVRWQAMIEKIQDSKFKIQRGTTAIHLES
jgi:DNA polymerase I